ncbi:MAG: heparinase, partial [Pseudomonadota bacterium]
MSSIGLIWTAAVRGLAARITGARNRVAARRAALGARPGEIAHQPEPRAVGATTRARELEAGLFRFAGTEVEAPKRLIWDVRAPSAAFTEEIHRCGWLDDLAAAGDASARRLAQAWVLSWIGRFGRGRAPAWAPGIAGWRTMRWVVHAPLLLKDQDSRAHAEILRSLDRHARYLARRWHAAPAGLPRFAALAGLLHAALALSGARRFGPAARAGLARECARAVDETGGIPTRNPEELLELFTLLVWMSKALTEAGEPAEPALEEAIDRIAPTLRSLRLGDGSLARFHGGGPGPEGQLDQVLAESGRRGTRTEEAAMGFLRLHAGRTTMILDAAPPPTGAA